VLPNSSILVMTNAPMELSKYVDTE